VAREGEAVENVAEIHHEPGHRRGQWADARGDELHGEELHRPRIDDDGENGGPPPREASLGHDQAECEAEGNQPQADNPQVFEGGADLPIHG